MDRGFVAERVDCRQQPRFRRRRRLGAVVVEKRVPFGRLGHQSFLVLKERSVLLEHPHGHPSHYDRRVVVGSHTRCDACVGSAVTACVGISELENLEWFSHQKHIFGVSGARLW